MTKFYLNYKNIIINFIKIFIIINIIFIVTSSDFEISDYEYPDIEKDKNNSIYRIAIFATNDFHGKIFPKVYNMPNSEKNETYTYGGAEYIYAQAQILKNHWKNQFLWLDAGDQMTGGIEFTLKPNDSNDEMDKGKIITDFFNFAGLNATTIGNREFDYNETFLKNFMERSNYDYLSANIYKCKYQDCKWENISSKHFKSQIYEVGEIKLGIIGLASEELITTGSGFLKDEIKVEEHLEILVEEARKLRSEGANSVILLAHMGLICNNEDMLKLANRKRSDDGTSQTNCSVGTLKDLLGDISDGVIDAVIGGHSKKINHHWINGIPVVQGNGIYYSNIIYLPFNSTTKQLIREDISIEGPLPACEKVFNLTSKCEFTEKIEDSGELVEYTFHGEKIEKSEGLSEILNKYIDEYNEKANNIIAYTSLKLQSEMGADSILYNLITDIGRKVTGADVCIFNIRGVVVELYPGPISEADIYEIVPYETRFVTIEMGGNQLNRMLYEIQQGQEIHPSSGLMQLFRKDDDFYKLVEVTIFDGNTYDNIDPTKTYTVCIDSFLIEGKLFFDEILKWYKIRGMKTYLLIREAITDIFRDIHLINEDINDDYHFPRIRYLRKKHNKVNNKQNSSINDNYKKKNYKKSKKEKEDL